MKSDINLKSLIPQLKKAGQLVLKHAIFIAIVVVVLAYSFVVWQINKLSNAEPGTDSETTALAKTIVPRIDKSDIDQIQNLENTNIQVKSLFDQARNNPFQE